MDITFAQLKSKGYSFKDHSTCRNCGDSIEWWETPNGKMIAFDPLTRDSEKVSVHFESCSDKKD